MREAIHKIEYSQSQHLRILAYKKYLPRIQITKKRALLDYLSLPVMEQINGVQTIRFSNSGIALSWARVLNELGYTLDIIDWSDKTFEPLHNYDLVVVHGGQNFNQLQKRIAPGYKLIYFSTGSYWQFNNQAELNRLESFKKRHKVNLPPDRYIYDSEEKVNDAADGIIVLGNASMRDTYPKKYKKILSINNASYPDDHFDKTQKEYDEVKHNFLFFAGSGNIHKGLDLLIDAFKGINENLYIVTVPDNRVLAVFKKELRLPNIHLIGDVNMRTQEFYQVMDKCAFVILPSCSEGQAGSVVEAMNQGLIPIVSKETRLDTSDFGMTLKSNSVKEIKKIVIKLASLDPKTIEDMARKSRAEAVKNHNPGKFNKDLKGAIKKIISTT